MSNEDVMAVMERYEVWMVRVRGIIRTHGEWILATSNFAYWLWPIVFATGTTPVEAVDAFLQESDLPSNREIAGI